MTAIYRKAHFFLLFFFFFPLFVFCDGAGGFKGWAHLELGAGNYGADGHSKISQEKTVLKKITYISEAKNYIDKLQEKGSGDYKPEEQYGILFWTLDELVNRLGKEGVFHVNDLYDEYAQFAADKLKAYANAKGYDSIIIEVVSGDYQGIESEKSLSKYCKKKYDSVHLKNPEISFFHEGIDGRRFLSSEKTRNEARTLLQNLANLSNEGLYLFIIKFEIFVPEEERRDFVDKGIFYLPTQKWEPLPYIYPDGEINEKGKVLFIPAGSSDTR